MFEKWISIITLIIFSLTAGVFAETVIIDNQSNYFSASGTWSPGTSAGYHCINYGYVNTVTGDPTAIATFTLSFSSGGTYDVSTWYVQGSNRPTDAQYIINHSGGTSTVYIDQTTNGSSWVSLGTFTFPATGGWVNITNKASIAGKAVMADAIKCVRQGTTYGDLYQAMWVNSWGSGFLSASETTSMINTARQNNMNAVFVEVRKTGDAYYQSATEPRASNIDPGYADPLADIIQKAHDTSGGKQYIQVHTWIVPYRVWTDSQGTPPSSHVWNEHPEWRGQTNTGSTSDGSWYIDPGVPGVTDYIVDVVKEIVENYDVDGVHFDYFRYPGTSWGYNPTAISRFNTLYSKSGQPATNDSDFCNFRRDQIRQMGRKVYATVKGIKWDCLLSAATIQWGGYYGNFTTTSAYAGVFQDWPGFMSEGLLDMNVLMNYKNEDNSGQATDYRNWANFLASTRAGRFAVNGHGSYMNSIHNSITQLFYALDISGICGTNIYAYQGTNDEGAPASDFWNTLRYDCYNQRRNPPNPSWISNPAQGILRGTVRDAGGVLDGKTVTLSNGATGTIKTDGTGFYAFLKLNPGSGFNASVTHNSNTLTRSFNITAGELTTLNFDFTQHTLTVSSAYDSPTPTVGGHDYTSGTIVSASIASSIVDEPPGKRYVCTGWTGTGFTPSSGSGSSASFTINQPSTLTWNWKTQYQLLTSANPPGSGYIYLDGTTTPADGWYDEGANVNILAVGMSNTPGQHDGYHFVNWSGDLTGTDNPAVVNMVGARSVTGQFLPPATTTSDWMLIKR
ncbi:MAG: family 10 glycosylhydrolase [Candidatus Sumerlaeota bacterium]|nr:family 10 glycosylhydrolase [Candidatus Sumerlaeota bacterium]